MTDDALRVLTEEERARIQGARRTGDTCAGCGRALAEGETVWMERLAAIPTHARAKRAYWWSPVGEECASPEFVRATRGRGPELCGGCGRGVHYRMASPNRRMAFCSLMCDRRYRYAQSKERTPS
jgi:hypothetical protein